MLGFYDYTVWLTYISLASAGAGIMISLYNQAHPFIGAFFLLICGLCDAFDGRVARTKKNRTEAQKKYGIQIDSLADIVCFGVLPACIGNAMMRVIPSKCHNVIFRPELLLTKPLFYVCYAVMIFYILAALIRLAYFNVMEEERQATEEGCRKTYVGLPVTASALIFPTVLMLQYILPDDVTMLYFVMMAITGIAFISPFEVVKPGLRGILIMVGIGAVEFILLAIFWAIRTPH